MSDTDYEYMSVENAEAEINEIMADADHVYHAKINTPGREKAMEHVTMLFKVKCNDLHPDPPDPTASATPVSPEFASTMADAITEKAVRDEDTKTQLRRDMRTEIEAVNKSMEGSNIDVDAELKDPTSEKLQGYQMMALLGRGDFKTLTPLILDDCRRLGMAAEKVEQISGFLTTAEPGDPLSDDLTNIIIRHIHKAKERRQENV